MSILTHMRQRFVKIKLVANKKTENSKTNLEVVIFTKHCRIWVRIDIEACSKQENRNSKRNLEVVDVYPDPYATVFRED